VNLAAKLSTMVVIEVVRMTWKELNLTEESRQLKNGHFPSVQSLQLLLSLSLSLSLSRHLWRLLSLCLLSSSHPPLLLLLLLLLLSFVCLFV